MGIGKLEKKWRIKIFFGNEKKRVWINGQNLKRNKRERKNFSKKSTKFRV